MTTEEIHKLPYKAQLYINELKRKIQRVPKKVQSVPKKV